MPLLISTFKSSILKIFPLGFKEINDLPRFKKLDEMMSLTKAGLSCTEGVVNDSFSRVIIGWRPECEHNCQQIAFDSNVCGGALATSNAGRVLSF